MSYINGAGSGSSGTGNVQTLTGNSGGPVGPTLNNIDLIGSGGVTITGNPGTSTLTVSVSGSGITWNVITASSVISAPDNGYITNNVSVPVNVILPALITVGSVIQVTGLGAGGWTISQNSGQSINFGNQTTTVGVSGELASINQFDSVELVCVVTDTTFNVTSAIGNITVT